MMELTGKSVFGGIAMGRIVVYHKAEQVVERQKVTDTERETKRFEHARQEAKKQLQDIYQNALKEIGEDHAMIFEVHQMMLDDGGYLEAIKNMITCQQVNAEFAVAKTGDTFSEMFQGMDDEYMRARAQDVKDISNRVISILMGEGQTKAYLDNVEIGEKRILLADDLAPSETVQLDKEQIASFVTRFGSANSHTAILARTMNIPALIGVNFNVDEMDGKWGIVDGNKGILIVDPTSEQKEAYQKKLTEQQQEKRRLLELRGKQTITKNGRIIQLYANIGSVSDTMHALQNDAEGIGLFRSEFLYLESLDYPSEEKQFQAYKSVLESMGSKEVIIRTLDIGADKQADYFHLDHEENPAMGVRAIRLCLTRKELFKTQLRAIYRAAVYGNASIMLPMITSVEEVLQAKQLIFEVKEELQREGVPFGTKSSGDVLLGIMIETPAAVMISDLLAKEVSFFSIGTNDLTQYTLAMDRQNEKLASFFNPHHEAVLRMIQMVADNGHKEKIRVGICGELGADLLLTQRFIEMGIDELSVSPGMLLRVREKIRSC